MKPDKITVHCSASNWGDAQIIDTWHRERGFARIGYHAVILNGFTTYASWANDNRNDNLDGYVEPGRPEDIMGAHVLYHNQNNLGICLIGITEFTDKQMSALKQQLSDWMWKYNLKIGDIYGHNEFPEHKTRICPGFNMTIFRTKFRLERLFI